MNVLKIKEISYIHCESYNMFSLKHGPLALITNSFPVILFINKENSLKSIITYNELITRGAYVIIITNTSLLIENNNSTFIIEIKNNLQDFEEILFAIILQLISYNISIIKKINPDKPRNLAKCVTVA